MILKEKRVTIALLLSRSVHKVWFTMVNICNGQTAEGRRLQKKIFGNMMQELNTELFPPSLKINEASPSDLPSAQPYRQLHFSRWP